MAESNLADVWHRITDLDVVSGSGSWVTAADGTEYLDFTSGIAVTSTGHCHPHVVQAVQDQAARFLHAQPNVYRHDLLEPLARRLAELVPGPIDTFFFANSGAEAIEAAIKIAKQTTGRPNVIVFEGSFHGRTHLAMAMTTSKVLYRAGYAPLPSGVFIAPFPDHHRGLGREPDAVVDDCLNGLESLLQTQTAPNETAAVVLEPVLGEGGYIPCPKRFLRGVAEICRKRGVPFVADEVQTGFGRTGTMFAVEHFDIEPDIIVLGKGMGSGFPISAIGAPRSRMRQWPVGSHGGTYGGNPMGCAAALATLDVLNQPGFLQRVRQLGTRLTRSLSTMQHGDPRIVDVRGPGLMIGVEFADPADAQQVQAHCLHHDRLILMTAGPTNSVIRWMPPLVVSESDIEFATQAFGCALAQTR
jgi:4-aminobutyrate aminotransferase